MGVRRHYRVRSGCARWQWAGRPSLLEDRLPRFVVHVQIELALRERIYWDDEESRGELRLDGPRGLDLGDESFEKAMESRCT